MKIFLYVLHQTFLCPLLVYGPIFTVSAAKTTFKMIKEKL
jgi:hypothetical protein